MKKIFHILLILVLIIPGLFVPSYDVNAETLGDLKAELNKKKAEMEANKQEQQLTEEQIAQTKQGIEQARLDIEQAEADIIKLSEEIVKLEEDIKDKEQEIKDIMNLFQITNGESAYLDYAFGAKDFTDFIYRMAISEQLADYNDDLIDKFNKMIEENNQKKIELNEKKEALKVKQAELEKKYAELGVKRNELLDISVSIEDEIKSQEEVIKLYEDLGCKDNEDVLSCGRSTLPPDTKFWRPVISGRISSDYGNRCYWLNGSWTCDFHTGIDMTQSGSAVPVYAAARGVVAATVRWSCGGNIIFINHNIGGAYYTTVYMHLRRILVSPGDVVTKDTQIAVMGGNPSLETWDSCSTGQHTHFMISNGMYKSWSSVIAGLINPRTMVNFPPEDGYFYDRISRY